MSGNLQLPKCERIEEVRVMQDGRFLLQWSAKTGPERTLTYGLVIPENEGHALMRKLSAAWLASGRPGPNP